MEEMAIDEHGPIMPKVGSGFVSPRVFSMMRERAQFPHLYPPGTLRRS